MSSPTQFNLNKDIKHLDPFLEKVNMDCYKGRADKLIIHSPLEVLL